MQGQKSNCGWTPYQDHHSAEFKINLRIFLSPLKLAALKRTCSLLFLDYLTMWAWKLAINCPQLFTMECALRMQHSIKYRVAAQEYLYIYMLWYINKKTPIVHSKVPSFCDQVTQRGCCQNWWFCGRLCCDRYIAKSDVSRTKIAWAPRPAEGHADAHFWNDCSAGSNQTNDPMILPANLDETL